MSKKLSAILMSAVAVIVIILGLTISTEVKNPATAGYYDVPGASFGADFYTYVYDGIDTMVDEMSSINNNIVRSQHAAVEAQENTAKACKIIVISIGLAIFALALKTFADASGKKAEKAPAEQRPMNVAFTAPQPVQFTYAAPQPDSAAEQELPESAPAVEETVVPEIVGDDAVRCPACQTVQRSGRSVCMQCGKKFIKTSF